MRWCIFKVYLRIPHQHAITDDNNYFCHPKTVFKLVFSVYIAVKTGIYQFPCIKDLVRWMWCCLLQQFQTKCNESDD